MMKLGPDALLHLLVYRHRYATKGSVVQFVRLQHPRYVLSDGEALSLWSGPRRLLTQLR